MKAFFLNTIQITLFICSLNNNLFGESFIVPKKWTHPEIPLDTKKRLGCLPYIAGDTFRYFCTFIIDETEIPFNPELVKNGDTLFVGGNYLDFFTKKIHPKIKNPYVLITHNSLQGAPGEYINLLNDQKIIAWFGKNISISNHPKLFAIPLGITNKHWRMEDPTALDRAISLAPSLIKKNLLYMNFNPSTNNDRSYVETLFQDKSFCFKSPRKPLFDYLIDLGESKFVLSPEGAGTDCHRTWEALLMGSIPVVKHSTIDELFKDLPVLLINDWKEVTEELLERKWLEMKKPPYQIERIYAKYWLDKITCLIELYRHKNNFSYLKENYNETV